MEPSNESLKASTHSDKSQQEKPLVSPAPSSCSDPYESEWVASFPPSKHKRPSSLMSLVPFMLALLIGGTTLYYLIPAVQKEQVAKMKAQEAASLFAAAEASSQSSAEPAVPTTVPTPRATPYDASAQTKANLLSLQGTVTPASLITSGSHQDHKASITLDGLLQKDIMARLIELVSQHRVEVSFFATGTQAAEAPDLIEQIVKAGYPVGNYTMTARPHMETMSVEELVADFTASQKIFEVITGSAPDTFKGNATSYTQDLLLAAGASGLSRATQSAAHLTFHSFKSYEEVLAWVNRLPAGSIVSVKLSGQLDASEYQTQEPPMQEILSHEVAAPAQIRQVALEQSADERLLEMVGWLMRAIEEADYNESTVALRQSNQGKLATPIQSLKTSRPAVSYLFYGSYEQEEELQGILSTLQQLNGTGTFFVSEHDLTHHPAAISRIAQAGHTIGLARTQGAHDDFYSAVSQLTRASRLYEELLGSQPLCVMQPFGSPSDALKEAVCALGLQLVQQDMSMAREGTHSATTPQEVISSLYKDNTLGFQRGAIIGFRLGYFDQTDLLSQILGELQDTRNAYDIAGVLDIAGDQRYLYTYPLTQAEILPEVYNRVYPGQLPVSPDDLAQHAKDHYIGNHTKSTFRQLPGFDRRERALIDKDGRMDGAGNTVFLTFDDWGTDVPVTRLLNVLKKHGVKATFFIRTNYVPHNPNLLRAIAMDGHEIASHSDTHYALSVDTEVNYTFIDLTPEQRNELEQDLIRSWQTLQSITGDLRLDNGMPALTLNFRPPTMAIGKTGMQTVYDLGFEYIVNGSYSSGDYEAASKEELLAEMKRNITGSAVAILHFSDNSLYTAEALDDFLTLNAARTNPLTFARLTDYLQAPAEQAAHR